MKKKVLALVLCACVFLAGYWLGSSGRPMTDGTAPVFTNEGDWRKEFELFSMQVSSMKSGLEKGRTPEAGDIYLLRLFTTDLSSFYARLGYEDLGEVDSHKLSLTYLDETCFAVMTNDLADYTADEWRAFLDELEPLRELGQTDDLLTLDQALTKLDEALQPE